MASGAQQISWASRPIAQAASQARAAAIVPHRRVGAMVAQPSGARLICWAAIAMGPIINN